MTTAIKVTGCKDGLEKVKNCLNLEETVRHDHDRIFFTWGEGQLNDELIANLTAISKKYGLTVKIRGLDLNEGTDPKIDIKKGIVARNDWPVIFLDEEELAERQFRKWVDSVVRQLKG